MNKILAQKILKMAKRDQAIRKVQFGGKKRIQDLKKIKEMVKALMIVDVANTAEMKKIIGHYGWPGRELVGKAAAHMAWLLVQHADHDLKFQKQCLKLMNEAVKRKDADKKDLAFLTDRVLVHEKKKQLYGTQFQGTENGHKPFPISDVRYLDKRRLEMGLGSFKKYAKKIS